MSDEKDDDRVHVLGHLCPHHPQAAAVRVGADGSYIGVGTVRVPEDGNPFPEHVEVLRRQPDGSYAPTPKGPAKVATAAYRTGWDTCFGSRQPVGQA
jgi:hypothetical protein